MEHEAGKKSLKERLKRYALTDIRADISHLSEHERQALEKLVEAARLMDAIYLRQVWDKNETYLQDLKRRAQASQKEEDQDLLRYYKINFGPWDRLDEEELYLDDSYEVVKALGPIAAKPKGANFYPEDMSKEEFDKWVETLPSEDQEKAKGFFTTIRRNDKGELYVVPYAVEYKEYLEPAAKLLLEAADLVEDESVRNFLQLRSKAFLDDDYYASDVAWVDVSRDSKMEITIGPYEVYEDTLFNYKAAYEAFITIRDFEETKKLASFAGWMQELEDHLPVEPQHRNPSLGPPPPIVVVNEVLVGGERAGPQTAAFNLPNDEKVTKAKGSKLVILKNVQEAKFEKIMMRISELLIVEEQRKYISFKAFFTHILCHEMCHSLGPHSLNLEGRETAVRKELQELHSAIEEAKADIAGLWALQYLIDTGKMPKSVEGVDDLEKSFYVTFLAGAFRSIRFGLQEAHGKGQAVQLNYLLEAGGFIYDEQRKQFAVDFSKIKDAVAALVKVIITLQGEGSKPKAKETLDRYGVYKPEVSEAMARLADVPVDIEPHYSLY